MKDLTVEQKRCLELARIIREGLEGVKFDMCWVQARLACGTSGCIAGYAIAKYLPEIWAGEHANSRHAEKLLGLTTDEATALFFPDFRNLPGGIDLDEITPAMAADTLTRFALTGKVVWK